MLVKDSNNDVSEGFLKDVKLFEYNVRNVREEHMFVDSRNILPWVEYITKKHIDLEKSDYNYVSKFTDILNQTNIRKSVISCLVIYWMVELDCIANDKVLGGNIKLHKYLIEQS